MYTVVVEEVRKRFGSVVAVSGVSFKVAGGEIYCIVGPNGAGKTTTLRMVTGLIAPDGGRVEVLGGDPLKMSVEKRRKISYLPEDAGVYKNLSGIEYLEFVAGVYARSSVEAREMVERGIELSGLGDALGRRASSYSKGMKRRLALAAALMVEPEVVVLDEPTAGLDVSHALAVRDSIISYVRSSGASAILSSHNMLEVEYICSRVGLISRGRIVDEGSPEELKARYEGRNLEEVYVKVVGGVS